jgi:hypothetical protein
VFTTKTLTVYVYNKNTYCMCLQQKQTYEQTNIHTCIRTYVHTYNADVCMTCIHTFSGRNQYQIIYTYNIHAFIHLAETDFVLVIYIHTYIHTPGQVQFDTYNTNTYIQTYIWSNPI